MVTLLLVYLIGLALYTTALSRRLPDSVSYLKLVTVSIIYPAILLIQITAPIYLKMKVSMHLSIGIGSVTDEDED